MVKGPPKSLSPEGMFGGSDTYSLCAWTCRVSFQGGKYLNAPHLQILCLCLGPPPTVRRRNLVDPSIIKYHRMHVRVLGHKNVRFGSHAQVGLPTPQQHLQRPLYTAPWCHMCQSCAGEEIVKIV